MPTPKPPNPAAPAASRLADDVLDGLDEAGKEEGEDANLEPSEITTRPSTNNYKRHRRKAAQAAATKPRQGSAYRPGESRHSPRRIEAVEAQKQALEMRMRGLAYSAIAKEMGLASAQTAWNMVESALQRTIQEPADAVRQVELGRLDMLFMVAFHKAVKERDMHASQQVLNIMNRRARLQGLDMPVLTKTEVSTAPQGTIVVASVMEPDAWDALAKAQQAEALVDRAALDKEDKAKEANGEGAEGKAA